MSQQTVSPTTTQSAAARLGPSAWTHRTARPFVALAVLAVVGGALASAAMAPAPSYHGSWAVAYIVLVVGAAQAALGVAQASATDGAASRRVVAAEAVCFNAGAAATVAATLLSLPAVLYAGAVLQVVALALFVRATRRGTVGRPLATLRIVAAIMFLSVPTGIVLQALTH